MNFDVFRRVQFEVHREDSICFAISCEGSREGSRGGSICFQCISPLKLLHSNTVCSEGTRTMKVNQVNLSRMQLPKLSFQPNRL